MAQLLHQLAPARVAEHVDQLAELVAPAQLQVEQLLPEMLAPAQLQVVGELPELVGAPAQLELLQELMAPACLPALVPHAAMEKREPDSLLYFLLAHSDLLLALALQWLQVQVAWQGDQATLLPRLGWLLQAEQVAAPCPSTAPAHEADQAWLPGGSNSNSTL